MKKLLLLLIVSFSHSFYSQLVFCPPGSEWRYSFKDYYANAVTNEKISYVKDSVINNDAIKILKHRYCFNSINNPTIDFMNTWVRQNGDTVFIKNKYTQNAWQILYNFNVQAGDTWQSYVRGTYTVSVDSITIVNINGFSLKRIYVRYTGINHPFNITERLGSSEFMFNSYSQLTSDGGHFQDNLCYKDSTFGNIQFTTKPCDFVDYVGLNEETFNNVEIKAYPNPTNGKLNIDFSGAEKLKLVIKNTLGQEVFLEKILDSKKELDISHLTPGVYFLTVQKANRQTTLRIILTAHR